jgi:DNA repair protein RecN (Recombination protein N)
VLDELRVRDFAIIDDLRLQLQPGLNVLTGETGAGKSILVDALGALIGARMTAEVVRSGSHQSLVEGIISLSSQWLESEAGSALHLALDSAGIGLDNGSLVIVREINRQGRAVVRLDGRAVPVRTLQAIGRILIDIHGQGEQQSLVEVNHHRDLLDAFAGLTDKRQMVAASVAALSNIRRELASLRRAERELAQRVDLLAFQIAEIEDAKLRSGEQEDLEAERMVLANAGRLAGAAQQAHQLLREGVGEAPSSLDLMANAIRPLREVMSLDPALADIVRALDQAFIEIEEVERDLHRYGESLEANPTRLEEVEDRLALVHRLRRKYGDTINDILAYGEKARLELDSITRREERLNQLEQQKQDTLGIIAQKSAELSAHRRQAGQELASAVLAELAELGMGKANFDVVVEQVPDEHGVDIGNGERVRFDPGGIDKVEFMIAPNPGEPLLPLAKVASGGELARTMLALKTALAEVDATPTLVFDEVDSGVGGRSGDIVGRKLWSLGQHHQVLCVTHLPQVAVYADAHFRVQKDTQTTGDGAERTITSVRQLSLEEQVSEIGAMLGGSTGGQFTQLSAKELLESAHNWKVMASQHMPSGQ